MEWIGPLKKYELQINEQSWKRGIKNVWPEENESLKNNETFGINEKIKNLWE